MTPPSLSEMVRVFGRIGLLSFGGPAAQIALMHRELVDERPWLDEAQFLNALSFCMLLPGPEAMQLATYAGWRLRGLRGGLIAGLLFVLPGACVVLALSVLYGFYGTLPLTEVLFLGIKCTVVVIVLQALLNVARKALQGPGHWLVAGLSFAAIFLFNAPFPAIIAIAAGFGFLSARGAASHADAAPAGVPPARTLRTVATWGALWAAPIACAALAGWPLLTEIGLFFSKLAIVTFGGAYAVLAYMTQAVVVDHGWLTTAQMMDGLGLAETTPGPLILVTQFVGYQAGAAAGGVALGLAAALMVLWVTFTPCFLWIFAGAPYIEWIAARPALAGALKAITAAVVGVILNLSIWFALHLYFTDLALLQFGPARLLWPAAGSFDGLALALTALAALLLAGLRMSLLAALPLMALAGAGALAVAG
ncbi:putative chromate transport protein [Pseudoruegeria aquimaris]|uniref:Putative chromate transport protein n=1 Tax=Pseudoruegeria aquimaris TaxID=393663 RepID=A0A1Y5RMU4_9RHOB|nr:chromate efflux transporter [Pseudoruegeria aquimaris]SLN21026.1 putative chromate transport protein [Pseudoruegeria aquimaris]